MFGKLWNALTGGGKQEEKPAAPTRPIEETAWVDPAYTAQLREREREDPEAAKIAREQAAASIADDMIALNERVTSYGVGPNPFDQTAYTNTKESPYPHQRDGGGNRIPQKRAR